MPMVCQFQTRLRPAAGVAFRSGASTSHLIDSNVKGSCLRNWVNRHPQEVAEPRHISISRPRASEKSDRRDGRSYASGKECRSWKETSYESVRATGALDLVA